MSPYIAQQQHEAADIIEGIPRVARIRSGGQTGADRGGLDAARECGLPICGWCPPGGLAEDYQEAPGLRADYPELVEGHATGYVERTAWNVRDSHATLIVAPKGLEPQSGTEMTAIFAGHYERPCLIVDSTDDAGRVVSWLLDMGRGLTLNVAGPRESKCPGVYQTTRTLVTRVLRNLAEEHRS